MSARPAERGLNVLGLGAAACAACCAGPILGFLATAGLFTLVSVVAFGAAGLVLLVPAVLWWKRRRRATDWCRVPERLSSTSAARH